MPVWGWIVFAAGGWIVASLLFAALLARMFATFSAREEPATVEFDEWSAKPPTRATAAAQAEARDGTAISSR